MKTLDIDKFIPDYRSHICLPKRATKREKEMYLRAARVHTASASYRNGTFGANPPGTDPKKVLDWRSLERRCAELDAKWIEANTKFWDAVMAARVERGLSDDEDLYVCVEDEWVLKCNSEGFSHENTNYITDELIKGKRTDRKFVVMKYGEGGAEIGRLNRRSNMLLRCKGVYERILERALRDRLNLYVDSVRSSGKFRNYFPTQIYVIENEGRVRVAQSDSLGRITWINGEVLITGQDETG